MLPRVAAAALGLARYPRRPVAARALPFVGPMPGCLALGVWQPWTATQSGRWSAQNRFVPHAAALDTPATGRQRS